MTPSPADRYRASLPPGEVEEFGTSGLDRVGIPAWSATWRPPSGTGAGGGLGYGATEEEARTGAYGELVEMVVPPLGLAPLARPRASHAEMRRREGPDRVADPRTLALEAGCDYDDDRPLDWLPTTRHPDGETVWVPAEFVASTDAEVPGGPPPGGWLTTLLSNGQGAGLDRERALSHALLELLQRDGNGLAFRAMDRGTVVDVSGTTDPGTRALLDRLDAADVDVTVKLATTELGLPNVYCVGAGRGDSDDAAPVALTACGEAVHPDRERAVRKAVLEFAAARARKVLMHGPLDAVRAATPPGYVERHLATGAADHGSSEPRALQAMLAWTRLPAAALRELLAGSVLAERDRVALTDLPTTPGLDDPAALLADVTARLAAEGMAVLHADVVSGEAHAVKAVVPGLEVETMSYGRIGERGVRKLLARHADGLDAEPLAAVGGRPDGPGWARVHLTPEAEERLGGPAWLDRAGVDRRVGDLYALYREPGRHVVAVARGER